MGWETVERAQNISMCVCINTPHTYRWLVQANIVSDLHQQLDIIVMNANVVKLA